MENQILTILQKRTGPDSASTDRLIREWLFRFGQNFGKETAPLLILWQEQLGGIEPAVLQQLFEHTIRTCKFFPTIAEILEHVKRADTTLANLEAENAWQKALAVSQDFGMDYSIASAREIDDPALDAAIRAAGGCRWIATCPQDQLPFAKRNFLEIYAKHKALPELAQLCNRKDSPALAEAIHTLAERKSLPR